MHAPPAPNKIQSNINLCFGQKITTQSTPFFISLIYDIFSQKNQNIRFNMQQMLNLNIDDNTLLIELKVKQGYGSQLADKIIAFLKTNQAYQKMNKQNKVQIKAIGKQDKCYVLIQKQSFAESYNQISKLCQQIQVDNSQIYANNSIKLEIKSTNSCDYMRKLLDNEGSMRALFDSMEFNFSFQKTKLVEKVLEKIFSQIQMQHIIAPLKGFNNLNLSLNFASSSNLDNYQQLRNYAKIVNKIETYFFTPIKGQYKEDIKFYYFNPVLSFTGKILAEQVQTLLEALFEEPKKEN